MFDSQTIEMSNHPSCRTNEAPWIDKDKVAMCDSKTSSPSYFRPSANKAVDN